MQGISQIKLLILHICDDSTFFNLSQFLCRTQTCSKTMPGSLGHEEQDAKTFASWVTSIHFIVILHLYQPLSYVVLLRPISMLL